jgi:pimeloyl-ACP methyl ester carboxylesterase
VARGYLELPWGQVHYRTVNRRDAEGLPLLLVLHQTPLHSGHYEAVLPVLSEFTRPIAFDTPGYGWSDPVPDGWEMEDYADLVWQIADRVGRNGGSAVLLGRATGSVIALAAAHRAPQRTQGLVLHGLPVYTEETRRERLASGFAEPIDVRADGGHLRDLWQRVLSQYPYLGPAEVQWHVEAYLACGRDYATAYRAMWRYDPQPALRSPSMPVHLLGGDADRVFGWFDVACAALPSATSHVFSGGTDFIAADDPAGFAAQVAKLIARTIP